MHRNEIEVFLKSSEPGGEYNPEVTLEITAYFRESSIIDGNTLSFHCDPIGSNYRSSYLEITLDDWSKVVEIRDFLADCFSDDTISRQTMTVEIENGVSSITPHGERPNEKEGLDEITIEVNGDRIEFQRSGTLLPYIFTYEERIENEPQDQNNAEKLLKFFDKIISLHPDFNPSEGNSDNPEVDPLFNQYRVESLLNEIVSTDSALFNDYQKAVREFENGEYADSIRDVGRASEVIVRTLSLEVHDTENLPDNTGGRLNTLDKTTDGLPSFIGKTVTPLWWLRNQVAHANAYEVSEEEALYALLCFQMATEKLIGEYLDI